MDNLNGKWTYDIDGGESWSCVEFFDTKEESIEAGKDEAINGYPFDDIKYLRVGQVKEFVPKINGYHIVESVGEDAYEECGEIAEDYLASVRSGDIAELQLSLEACLHQWLRNKGFVPNFYSIENIEEIDLDKD